MDSSRWASIDLALLVLRIGIGVSFVFVYGADKMLGGPARWAELGTTMEIFGVTAWPVAWGFMAAATEFVGGVCLMLGLLFRPILGLLLGTMFVAASSHIAAGEGPWHATEMATVFAALLLTGPGRYSIDAYFRSSTGAEEAEHV
ncbi:DoxX family protein [Salinibacter altiplanensis]|uniref:DoxX family protein n=1 Tax=Salinibacter altiplanensis TaxID=1803181 RepID=UPI000C9EFA60|nr:DoxX family protein [Salinibacter altiplanensis]